VHEHGNLEVGGERVHAAQLGARGFDVEFQFSEAEGSGFNRCGEELLGVRFRDVGGGEPAEDAPGILLVDRVNVFGGVEACEEHCVRNAAAVQMDDVRFDAAADIVMAIDYGVGPRVLRSEGGGGGEDRGELAAGHDDWDSLSNRKRAVDKIVW